MDLVRDYLLLALRIGRLADRSVHSWTGGKVLPRQVAAEPRPAPAKLANDARELLAGLADSYLDLPRYRFLAAQVRALECAARQLAGEPVSFLAQVEGYFDVKIRLRDPLQYEATHDRLSQLLPGSGSVRARLAQYHRCDQIPPGKLRPALEGMSAALRSRSARLVPLPHEEDVRYELVTDRPWRAAGRYLGEFRSEVTVNVDACRRAAVLPFVVSREAYPGRHSEHCIKDARLVLARAREEHQVALVNTPQALLTEGAAEAALSVATGARWGAWVEGILRDADVHLDGELAERVERAVHPLQAVKQDAAILLHDRGADPDDVVAYVRRWMLVDETRARRAVRFLTNRRWAVRTTARVEGARLVRSWLDAHPAAVSPAEQFRRLLSEPLVPQTLRDERDGC